MNRRDILRAINADLSQELAYIADIIIDNPKNYQVWHHRRVIVEWMNEGGHELDLTEAILGMDAKNYHAWQHRQWAIKTFKYVFYHKLTEKHFIYTKFAIFICAVFTRTN